MAGSGSSVLHRPQVAEFLTAHPRGVLGWVDPGGGPRQVPVWVMPDGDRLLFNGPTGRGWAARLRTDPRVSILVSADDRGLECRGLVDTDPDLDRARAVILELTRRIYPGTARPQMTQDLFRGDRLAVFSLTPADSHTIGLGR